MQHLGLLGGTFDPIHKGHLHLAKSILETVQLDEIRVIPCYSPVHRDLPIATAKQRLYMTKLACEGLPGLIADDIEIRRGGKSYMIDTLKAFKLLHPNSHLYLIIGYDAFMNFTQWKDWQNILKITHLIVAKRPHYNQQNEMTLTLIRNHNVDISAIKSQAFGNLCFIEIDALEISSTVIRKNIQENKDVSDILPRKVYDFIKKEGLYAN